VTIDSGRLYLRPEAAAELRLPTRTLDDLAYRGVGPAYYKTGRRTVYRGSDLLAWLETTRVESSEARAHVRPLRRVAR
jgi:hypothetical protein